MDRIESESIWLFGPCFADSFVGCEAVEGLQSACEIVGGDEVRQVGAQLLVGLVVEAFYGRLLDRAVHAFDLAVCPGMPGLGQAMINVILGTGVLERMRPEWLAVLDRELDIGGGRTGVSGRGEMGTVVCQDNVNPIGDG